VNLPTLSNYSYSSTGGMAASFSRDYNTDTVVIADNSFVYRFTTGFDGTTSFTNLYVQNGITTGAGSVSGSSLFILGVTATGLTSSTNELHTASAITNVVVGNATINSTDTTVYFAGGTASSIGTLTIDSGVVAIRIRDNNLNSIALPPLAINSINPASATTVSIPQVYSDKDLYIRTLTIATTGTINFSNSTVLVSAPNAVGYNWELGGRTIESTVIVSPNSRLDITDTANLGTTYIKNVVSSTSLAVAASPTIVFSSTSGFGGIFTHSYSSATRTLTFNLFGGNTDDIDMNLIYNITVPTGKSVAYSINYSISSEASFDLGSITISGATAVGGVSGISTGTASGSTSTSGQIIIRYTKDGINTGGSDTFSGTIVFSNVGELPSTLRFQAGRTFTFDKFFHDPTVYALTLASTSSGVQTNLVIPERNLGTLVQGTNPGGVLTATIQDCAVTSGEYIWYAGKYHVNNGNNSGWIFAESPTTLSTQFFL
jgi:phage-related protein